MIYLLTGTPGAGKSAEMVRRILEAVKAGRKVYVDGVPDLAVDHEPFDPTKWHDAGAVVDGALLVVDEAQRHFRPRGAGSAVPPCVAAMETHRHRGLDILLVTQAPSLIDSNIRRLVGNHVHLRNVGALGRWWYEWSECGNIEAFRTAPIKKRHKLPTGVFDKYKSASLHVKPKFSFPFPLVVLALVAVIGPFLGWRIYASMQAKLEGNKPAATPGAVPLASGSAAPPSRPAAPVAARLQVTPPVKDREPFAGLSVHLAGEWSAEGGPSRRLFLLTDAGRRVVTLRDSDVYAAGYAFVALAPCVGLLVHGGRERVVYCDSPPVVAPVAPGPSLSASGPSL